MTGRTWTGYTNGDIVTMVFREYDIQKMILRNIADSRLDHSYKDLEQLIYIELMKMERQKLNVLYLSGALKFQIVGIITKQRDGQHGMKYYSVKKQTIVNYSTSEYARSLKLYDHEQIGDFVNEDATEEVSPKMRFVQAVLTEFSSARGLTGATQMQLRLAVGSDLLQYYTRRKLSLSSVAKQFKMSRSKAATLIKTVKDEVKKKFMSDYKEDDWIDDEF